MLATILSVNILALAAISFTQGVGAHPAEVPVKERRGNTDVAVHLIRHLRKLVGLNEIAIYVFSAVEATFCLLRARELGLLSFPLPEQVDKLLVNALTDKAIHPQGSLDAYTSIGCILVILGSGFRAWAQRTLGKFFTWEVTIQSDHKLCTHGPYAVVRHPSYTGLIAMGIGYVMLGSARGTVFNEYFRSKLPLVHGFLWVEAGFFWVSLLATVFKRVVNEDAVLKGEFGKEWETWAQRTPHKLIPGVY